MGVIDKVKSICAKKTVKHLNDAFYEKLRRMHRNTEI